MRNVLLALLLGCAAIASWYSNWPQDGNSAPASARSGSALGYYIEGAVFRGLNAEGRVVYEISAARIEEHPSAENLSLEDVEISYAAAEDVPWRARAAFATAPLSREFVDLRGSVQLSTTDQGSGRETLIETEAMRFEPNAYLATTDGPVRLTVGDSWLTAAALEADLKSDVIRTSNVHAQVLR